VYVPMFRAHSCSLGRLVAARKLTFAPLGSVRDAEAALNDSVGAASYGARAFGGLIFSDVSDEG
jgi:hypothetical protein